MSELPDHFQLFNLAPRFALDCVALDRAYRGVQSQVHPDRFAAASAAESRVAMQWAARANEAYQTLKSPLLRAAYLCEQAGAAIDAESNTSMPTQFLLQQLSWREALDEARDGDDGAALQTLSVTTSAARDELHRQIETALDRDGDPALAAALVRQLMFIEKFAAEVADAQNAMTDSQRAG